MSRLRNLVVASLLLLLAATPAAANQSNADAARAERERVFKYWTAERMATAIPRDFVKTDRGFVPAAKPPGAGKPGGGGGGDGSTGTVTGASWTAGGEILSASGKVFFTMEPYNYQCSGSVAFDTRANASLVLTAAHCAYDETNGAFATNWVFIPEWDSQASGCGVHDCWYASQLVVHKGYVDAGGFNTQATLHDFAFAVVPPIPTSIGSLDIAFGGVSAGDRLYAFGYPAAQKYKGNDLTYCAGPIFTDPYNTNLTWGMTCDMTGGSSGGPWLSSFVESTGSGTLSSLNSYGYSGVKAMHGPKFDARTEAVYKVANGGPSNSNVIVSP
jgi:V8-like Glu-specific endopeptidase